MSKPHKSDPAKLYGSMNLRICVKWGPEFLPKGGGVCYTEGDDLLFFQMGTDRPVIGQRGGSIP